MKNSVSAINRQHLSEGHIDRVIFQRLKRKLLADKESDTESGNLKQCCSEGANSSS